LILRFLLLKLVSIRKNALKQTLEGFVEDNWDKTDNLGQDLLLRELVLLDQNIQLLVLEMVRGKLTRLWKCDVVLFCAGAQMLEGF